MTAPRGLINSAAKQPHCAIFFLFVYRYPAMDDMQNLDTKFHRKFPCNFPEPPHAKRLSSLGFDSQINSRRLGGRRPSLPLCPVPGYLFILNKLLYRCLKGRGIVHILPYLLILPQVVIMFPCGSSALTVSGSSIYPIVNSNRRWICSAHRDRLFVI